MKVTPLFCIAALAFTCADVHGWTGVSGKPYEGWPKVEKEMISPTMTDGHFRIKVVKATDQSGGGTGGAIFDLNVENMRTGKTLQIEGQSVGTRILETYHGYPQIEIWGRGGGGSYSRVLYRVEQGAYRAIRDDLFDVHSSLALRKDVTAIRPGGEATLYYKGTMYPEPENQ